MAQITIHAGLPKAGSSAIQTFLGASGDLLASRGITVATARQCDGHVVVAAHHARAPSDSGGIITPLRDRERGTEFALEFVRGVHAVAGGAHHVVMSGESLSQPFWVPSLRPVLAVLDQLASNGHACTIVMYLRPQHSALEAAWRQWGFRSRLGPADYIRDRAGHLQYERHLAARELAPHLDIRFRPFMRRRLHGNDVVRDFAHHFLDLEIPGPIEQVNEGFPLTFVNMMTSLPAGRLWESMHDNRALNRLRQAFDGIDIHDARADRGRQILLRWSVTRFERSNRAVEQALGWDFDDWFPNVEAGDSDLEALDELWRPTLGPSEAVALEHLLMFALGSRH